ncbi:5,10-methylenetetrahydrofolate reductase [bacterium BMS3Abin07]|nr:5,10-methylenetetrahydrofolate reductase [bacterium BMS3Abin07]
MKISEIFKKRDKGISFEFFPPKTEEGKKQLLTVAKELSTFDPMYASVTYGAGGTTQERTRDVLYMLKEETGLTLMSHLTCIGATAESMDSLLNDYKEHGIDNILALRGDPPPDVPDFDPTKGEFSYAVDLVKFIKKYDYFSISVAVYPEVHQEATSAEADLEYAKQKIDAGADFGISQMFFDSRYFLDFLDRAYKKGINIPILPGIMPITDLNKIRKFASFCKATIPKEVEDRMSGILDKPDEMQRVGIDLAVQQCEDLLDNGVKYLHFYTMNKSEAVSEIIGALKNKLN